MEKLKIGANKVSIFLDLLLIISMGAAYADEIDSCTKSCLVDLKDCSKQANMESHPILSGSSASKDAGTQLRSLRFAGNETSNSQNDELQRRMERYQACEYENGKCQNSCSPKPNSPKISVILK